MAEEDPEKLMSSIDSLYSEAKGISPCEGV